MKSKSALFVAFLSLSMFSLVSCSTAPPYEYVQSPGGQQMVACNNGNGQSFLMDLLLFNMLMSHGGYGSVINHYHSYPGRFGSYGGGYRHYNGPAYNRSSYSSFRSNAPTPTLRNTSPSAPSSTLKSTTPTSKPSGGSSFRSTPSRSSGSSFRSSSPSRSSGSSFRSSSSRRR